MIRADIPKELANPHGSLILNRDPEARLKVRLERLIIAQQVGRVDWAFRPDLTHDLSDRLEIFLGCVANLRHGWFLYPQSGSANFGVAGSSSQDVLALLLLMAAGPARLCPITHQPVDDASPSACVSGIEFRFASERAKAQFLKDPAGALATADDEAVFGVSFFDPVAGKSMILSRDGHIREADLSAVAAWSVRRGIAYPLSARSKRAFNGNPSLYAVEPERYSLWCPIMRKPIASIEKSTGYVDVSGTRYFVCCESCFGAVRGDRSGPGWEEAAAESKPWTRLTPSP